jgi:hypothetical protein
VMVVKSVQNLLQTVLNHALTQNVLFATTLAKDLHAMTVH